MAIRAYKYVTRGLKIISFLWILMAIASVIILVAFPSFASKESVANVGFLVSLVTTMGLIMVSLAYLMDSVKRIEDRLDRMDEVSIGSGSAKASSPHSNGPGRGPNHDTVPGS